MKKKQRPERNRENINSINNGLDSLVQQLEAYVVALRSAAPKRNP